MKAQEGADRCGFAELELGDELGKITERFRRIQGLGDDSHNGIAVDEHVVPLAGEEVRDLHGDGVCFEGLHRGDHPLVEVACRRALRFFGARSDDGVIAGEKRARVFEYRIDLGWEDRIQHGAADTVGVLPHDLEAEPGAVGDPEQVPLVVAERNADRLHVVGVVYRVVGVEVDPLVGEPGGALRERGAEAAVDLVWFGVGDVFQLTAQLGELGTVEPGV